MSPMGSSFAFPSSPGTRPATHWENKCWCQSLLWFQAASAETGTGIPPARAQGSCYTHAGSVGCVLKGSGDLTHRSLGQAVPTLLVHISSPWQLVILSHDYFPSQLIRTVLGKLRGRADVGKQERQEGNRWLPSTSGARGQGYTPQACPLCWSAPCPGPSPAPPSALAILLFLS